MRLNWNLSALVLALAVTGCGGEESTVVLAPVTGAVTLDGRPVDGATVVFSPKGEAPMSMAITDLNGKFELKTGSGRPGAAVGDHGIAVVLSITSGGSPPPVSPDGLAPLTPSEAGGGQVVAKHVAPRTVWMVPEKYSKPESSGLTATVPSGGLTDYKLELKK
ncbi:hypothetical protein Pan44_23620 [Caulifigura coniformis]|uniref:Carboxypeptidase regulatory-like domain-containing protein n=1 Tax=Caulifigura coniformis TaxID=2527983 RepID=A0A517SDY6_9PLAN|nr:hypothetical protein [Caulifigura coniformis]QDT54333.1 hypothetical protein Pan44_23620 [Caulifigura coniformis]